MDKPTTGVITGLAFGLRAVTKPGDKVLLSDAARILDQLSPIFSTVAAEAGLAGGDEWVDNLKAYLEINSAFLRNFVRQYMPGIQVSPHQGTYLMWWDCSCFGIPMGELAGKLVDECNVALQDGNIYLGDGDKHFRINIGCPQKLLRNGLEAILPLYETYCG